MVFNNRIKELRKEKNITQLRLSTELNVSQEAISSYESGKSTPSVASLIKMSEIFNTSMDYIMDRTDQRFFVNTNDISKDESRLLLYYRMLSPIQKEKTISYAQGLCDGSGKY